MDKPILSERERDVITMRFGIGDIEPMTLKQIAEIQGVTRERIRQIEAKALKKLRASPRVRHLRDYLD